MTHEIKAFDDLDAADQATARAIYEGGFEPRLRAPWESVSSAREPHEDTLVLTGDDGPVGFALLRRFTGGARVYLRYFVVGAELRGAGIGGTFMQRLTSHYADQGFSLLIWDVEHPGQEGIDSGEESIRRRRIGFYERAGGSVLPLETYAEVHDGVVDPMRLLAIALDASVLPSDTEWVRGVVLDVYTQRYGLGMDHPMVRTTMAELDDREQQTTP